MKSPALWGAQSRPHELFAGHRVKATRQIFNFRWRSAGHWLEICKTYYGPTNRAFAAPDAGNQAALQSDLMQLLGRMNRAGKDALIVPSEYLEVAVTKR